MFQSRQSSRPKLDVTLKQSFLITAHTQSAKDLIKDKKDKEQLIPLKLVNLLGLNSLLLDKIVFKRNPQKYTIRKIRNINRIISQKSYSFPQELITTIQILQTPKHSIPICVLKPTQIVSDNVIIYAHGNSSDLVQGMKYIEKVSANLGMQFILFDYTGYGCSSISNISQQSIREDLEIVLAWVTTKVPLEKIILWGFSLGTHPVIYCAAKYKVRGIILQSPMASIGCLFKQGKIDPDTRIENDYLVNLDYIHKVKCQIFIIHSKADDVIPISHSLALAKKYVKYNSVERIQFLEVNALQHNQMHIFFASEKENPIKSQLTAFLKRIQHSRILNFNIEGINSLLSSIVDTPQVLSESQLSISKIKLVSDVQFPNQGKKIKKQRLLKIRENIKLAQIPQYNEKQGQLEIQNGVIIKRIGPKADSCFCLQKC